jgi:hypothetical protein
VTGEGVQAVVVVPGGGEDGRITGRDLTPPFALQRCRALGSRRPRSAGEDRDGGAPVPDVHAAVDAVAITDDRLDRGAPGVVVR